MTDWNERRNYGYYIVVKLWLESLTLGMRVSSLLDVGCRDTPVSTWGTFDERYSIDVNNRRDLSGVRKVVGDFLLWDPPYRFHVATCLQTLEHLPDAKVERFAAKLREVADYALVSVPFGWPVGAEPGHLQDPIDLPKLTRIMGGPPDQHVIVLDGKRARVVGLWRNYV